MCILLFIEHSGWELEFGELYKWINKYYEMSLILVINKKH